jgi:hypothetical protein
MAYSFNGTNQFLFSNAVAPVTAAPLTLFARYNVTVAPGASTFASLVIVQNATVSDLFDLCIFGAAPSRAEHIARQGSGPVLTSSTITGVVAISTWYAQTAVEVSSTSRHVIFETTKSATDTTSAVPAGVDRFRIGGRSGGGRFFNGLMAEVAMWNADLTDDEVTSLARGFKPSRVRPQSLQFYAPIVRDIQELRQAVAITNSNTATVADHPRVY